MNTNLNKVKILFFVQCVLFAIATISHAEGISFHELLDNQQENVDIKLYQHGKDIINNYKLLGLSDNFLIKKQADFTLKNRSIVSIAIKKPNNYQNLFYISFKLTKESSARLLNYTKDNINKNVSINLDKNIISTVTITEPIDGDLVVFLSNFNDSILELLKKITANINIE